MFSLIRMFIPPIFIYLYKYLFKKGVYWKGNYRNWNEVRKESKGYNSEAIVTKVEKAISEVLKGNAAFERDSMLFKEQDFSWQLIASLYYISNIKSCAKLDVLDFGGSLGSTYLQNRLMIEQIINKWSIIEQENFVSTGKKLFKDRDILFFSTISEARAINPLSDSFVIILSSVIQYLEDPYFFINKEILDFEYIVFDRTPFVNSSTRLTKQSVPPSLYKATYPCWFFNEEEFLLNFKRYDIICSWKSFDASNLKGSYFKGFLLKKKS